MQRVFFQNTTDVEINYSEYFNTLRGAARYNEIEKINNLKTALTKEQFIKLLHSKNTDYSECAIIHYAAKFNRPDAIQALVGDFLRR